MKIGRRFKAALNLAADDPEERIGTRQAWERGLESIPEAERSRNVILLDNEGRDQIVTDLIAEAYKVSSEFGLFVEVADVPFRWLAARATRRLQHRHHLARGRASGAAAPRRRRPGGRRSRHVADRQAQADDGQRRPLRAARTAQPRAARRGGDAADPNQPSPQPERRGCRP